MKIALIRQTYTPFGGAERFLERAIGQLSRDGAQITVVARKWNDAGGHEVIACNPAYLGRTWRDWSFARRACRMLAQRAFQLVQSHERLPCCDVYRAGDGVHREWLRQRARVLGPWGRLLLKLDPYHAYTRRAERNMFLSPRLRAVICNSRMVRDEIRAYFDIDESKLHVIHSGVDTTAFHPDLAAQHRSAQRARLNIPESATLFAFVGSGYERKGLAAALQALATLPDTAYLVVVGKDRNAGQFQKLAATLGIEGRVRFMGPQPDVRPFYGSADALVLPTLYDPFPNVALEAMAAGLPPVISTKCGAIDIVTHDDNGFVCDALDTAAIADALRALTDTTRRRAMAERARSTAAEFTLDVMSRHYRQFYEALLAPAEPAA